MLKGIWLVGWLAFLQYMHVCPSFGVAMLVGVHEWWWLIYSILQTGHCHSHSFPDLVFAVCSLLLHLLCVCAFACLYVWYLFQRPWTVQTLRSSRPLTRSRRLCVFCRTCGPKTCATEGCRRSLASKQWTCFAHSGYVLQQQQQH